MEEKIINELIHNVNRDGVVNLLDYLRGSDFFKAPASTKFHLSCEGGLAQHSLNVYMELQSLNEKYKLNLRKDSMALCGLFHDICKANYYAREMRREKVDGVWVDKEVYVVRDQFPMGHGEKSVAILLKYIDLTDDEQLAVRWHMGKWEAEGYGQTQALNQALNRCKLLKALMLADQGAAYFLEGE